MMPQFGASLTDDFRFLNYDHIMLIIQATGQSFNSSCGRLHAMHSISYIVKLPNLELKIRPKQLPSLIESSCSSSLPLFNTIQLIRFSLTFFSRSYKYLAHFEQLVSMSWTKGQILVQEMSNSGTKLRLNYLGANGRESTINRALDGSIYPG